MQKYFYIGIGTIAALLIGGVTFLVHHQQPINNSVLNSTTQGGSSGRFGRSGRHFGNFPAGSIPIFGNIASVAGNALVIQRRNGTLLNVFVNNNTQYTGGTQTNLAANTRVGGYGTKNSDGTIIAQKLIINPSFGNRNSGNSNFGKSPSI